MDKRTVEDAGPYGRDVYLVLDLSLVLLFGGFCGGFCEFICVWFVRCGFLRGKFGILCRFAAFFVLVCLWLFGGGAFALRLLRGLKVGLRAFFGGD